jgi:hypothetical protein
MGAATIEDLAFGVCSSREPDGGGPEDCLSTVGINKSGTRLLEGLH